MTDAEETANDNNVRKQLSEEWLRAIKAAAEISAGLLWPGADVGTCVGYGVIPPEEDGTNRISDVREVQAVPAVTISLPEDVVIVSGRGVHKFIAYITVDECAAKYCSKVGDGEDRVKGSLDKPFYVNVRFWEHIGLRAMQIKCGVTEECRAWQEANWLISNSMGTLGCFRLKASAREIIEQAEKCLRGE